ncbi:MAG: cell division protein FtsQ/DivIB [Candidatus Contendobacter sp.]|nr:cell division protein FtsQ/DivIB [Candidatus Contendobacter sp.]
MRLGRERRRGATSLRRAPAARTGQWRAILKPWLRGLGVAVVLAAVGFGLEAGIRALRAPGAFPLRQVRVEGELRNLTETDLQPLASTYLGQNFFVANLDDLRVALAADPWVEEVMVRRGWPDTVAIHLRERMAFGYWGERGEMVDINGRRFHPAALRQSGPWPRLIGPEGREKALIQAWREVRAQLDPVGLTLVRLVQDERRAWWLTFDGGMEVYVGRDRFKERLQRLAHVYPRILAAQADRIAAVDLRYGNGFAVRWKTAPPAPAAS